MSDVELSILEDSIGPKEVSATSLEEITGLANLQSSLTKTVLGLEAELKVAKAKLRQVSEEDLPLALRATGLKSITLDDGQRIDATTFYRANISVKNRPDAHQWLRDHGFDDIIKNEVTATFGRGEDTSATDALKALNEMGYNCTQKESVHASTLKAFTKEQLEKGTDIPQELFGIYVGTKTIVK